MSGQAVFELKQAMEKEGLDAEPDFMTLLVNFYKVYMRMGLTVKAAKFKDQLTRIMALPRSH